LPQTIQKKGNHIRVGTSRGREDRESRKTNNKNREEQQEQQGSGSEELIYGKAELGPM